MYGEIFLDNSYLKHGVTLNPGAIVYDVGANIGMFALWAHRACKGDVRVLSFEPMPAIHRVCSANAARFGGDGSLRVAPVGLSDTARTAVFNYHPRFSLWSTAHAGFDAERMERLARDLPAMTENAASKASGRPLARPVAATWRAGGLRAARGRGRTPAAV